MGRFSKKVMGLTSVIVLAGVLSACSPTFKYHGYAPSDDEMSNIIVGADTRETVAEVLGDPTSSGVLPDGSWYYVSTKMRHFTYKSAKPVDRQLVAVSFDKNGVVENVERFGLKDGRVVTLSRRVTALPVKGPGILSQLLGNIGNFDIGNFTGG